MPCACHRLGRNRRGAERSAPLHSARHGVRPEAPRRARTAVGVRRRRGPRPGARQWADAGMYLQTVMLLLRAEGLHSCPQVMWTMYRKTVGQVVGADDGHVLLCGVSVGHEKHGAPRLRTDRADMAETVRFVGA
ncbi:oxidoreductase [Streptomyces sp. e14]|uniref:nitroreductase family protein n=1 Tax=Streptomyces sp. e14 TaxID=645465 RepID=UPI0001D06C6A|nr:nitroreductase family protein [Streptomyces sp. e14]EFF91316.1 oxidoreductase [Streptomyces sp. e14]